MIEGACPQAQAPSISRTQHSEQYTHHTYDMLPYHRITYNNIVFY